MLKFNGLANVIRVSYMEDPGVVSLIWKNGYLELGQGPCLFLGSFVKYLLV